MRSPPSRIHPYRDFSLKAKGGKWHRSATRRRALGNLISPGRGLRFERMPPTSELGPRNEKYAISFTLDGVPAPDNNDPTTVRTHAGGS